MWGRRVKNIESWEAGMNLRRIIADARDESEIVVFVDTIIYTFLLIIYVETPYKVVGPNI